MLSTKLGKITLKNPLILGSGILGVTGASLVNVAKNGAAGVTTKSISMNPREGHPNPTVLVYSEGLINAVGLSNEGVEKSIEEIKYARDHSDAVIIASIVGFSIEEFGRIAKEISKANPHMIELNLSCPNVEDEHGKPYATDAKLAAAAVHEVKKNTKLPIIAKLSPNVNNIAEIAQAVEKAGADAICAINTVGPGMVININAAKPVLANKAGGVSGPAIKPIAVRCVYDIYKAVNIPIIGIGGITTGEDAVEMMMAGASAVGIGSAVYYRGIEVFDKINSEIQEFMKKHGYKSISEIIGKAHEN